MKQDLFCVPRWFEISLFLVMHYFVDTVFSGDCLCSFLTYDNFSLNGDNVINLDLFSKFTFFVRSYWDLASFQRCILLWYLKHFSRLIQQSFFCGTPWAFKINQVVVCFEMFINVINCSSVDFCADRRLLQSRIIQWHILSWVMFRW